jgi:hypothetical protein
LGLLAAGKVRIEEFVVADAHNGTWSQPSGALRSAVRQLEILGDHAA